MEGSPLLQSPNRAGRAAGGPRLAPLASPLSPSPLKANDDARERAAAARARAALDARRRCAGARPGPPSLGHCRVAAPRRASRTAG